MRVETTENGQHKNMIKEWDGKRNQHKGGNKRK